MTESIWQNESCNPGRRYMLGKDPYIKYDDSKSIKASIVEGLRKFIHTEPAVRLTIDSPKSEPERAILAIPFETDQELLLNNFAEIIYQSTMGYYISAAPQTSHFGIANLLLEGKHNSLLKREMEKLIGFFQSRPDMAGRLLQNITLIGKRPVPKAGETFLADTIREGLDIHVGYRIFATGVDVNCTQIFLPIETGAEIIEQIYDNIERILHHNFVAYDEAGDGYLKLTDTLIFKDLCNVLRRARTKELTRNKILNNLQFDTVTRKDPEQLEAPLPGDRLYDILNHIQDSKLKEAVDRSRDLYTACMERSGQMAASQLKQPQAKAQLAAAEQAPASAEAETTAQEAPPKSEAAEGEAASPARKFQRRAPAQDGGRRRRFQKVELTADELESAKVQVPEPPKSNVRVPAPKGPRRITRVRKEETGAPKK